MCLLLDETKCQTSCLLSICIQQGHTMEVTGVAWHPIDKNTVLTSSLDGSVRIWDLLGESTFGNLCSKHVSSISRSWYLF